MNEGVISAEEATSILGEPTKEEQSANTQGNF